MRLIIKSKEIEANVQDVLKVLKRDVNRPLFKDIIEDGDNIKITCPFHKNGQESHPSCYIFNKKNSKSVVFGTVHCFTCGYAAPLQKFVADCLGEPISVGEDWLIKYFGYDTVSDFFDEPIQLTNSRKSFPDIDLSKYDYYHDYMWKRHLTREVVDRFRIGYDKEKDAITFPVWDEKGNLVMITERSVTSKKFYIPSNTEKPVYLLNEVLKCGYNKVYVVESQINCLTLWSWGYPSIALFGTGSKEQMQILNRSGIRTYILCFDGDSAGDHGIERFKRYIKNDTIVMVKQQVRDGRDVNDLTKEEFDRLPIK